MKCRYSAKWMISALVSRHQKKVWVVDGNLEEAVI
jgi:hypothetical protein